jgi:hypothetical protein
VANAESSRREVLTVKAHDPVSGADIDVFISQERLLNVASRSRGQLLEVRDLVPQALQCRGPIFEGLCKDADEDQRGRGVGWRCYCCLPDRSYSQDGHKCPPRRGQVYLVFVNEELVAYNWRWESWDPQNHELPLDHENRFKRRLS